MHQEVGRPALRYHGGKFKIAPWIISHFPPHECYVEPFGGAAGVLLRKPAVPFEIYNDLDGEVVRFFRVLRDHTEELIRRIELTPWSREEQRLSFEPTEDDLEAARRFYVRSWQTIGGPRTSCQSGWRVFKSNSGFQPKLSLWKQVDHLRVIVERLKGVQIENQDALKVIRRFGAPDVLIYADPPYLESVRSGSWRKRAYYHEMTDEDHRELAEVLRASPAMVIISGYASELYDELYGGWRVESRAARTDRGKDVVERLWMSPNTPAPQICLFD